MSCTILEFLHFREEKRVKDSCACSLLGKAMQYIKGGFSFRNQKGTGLRRFRLAGELWQSSYPWRHWLRAAQKLYPSKSGA